MTYKSISDGVVEFEKNGKRVVLKTKDFASGKEMLKRAEELPP